MQVFTGKTLAATFVSFAQSEGISGKFHNLVGEMTDIGTVSAIAVIKEMTKEFPKEKREADPFVRTAYQYASSFKAIWGAATFCNVTPAGGINAMRKTAVDALREAGLTWDGQQVQAVAIAKEEKAQSKMAGAAAVKGMAMVKNGELAGEDLAAFIVQEVTAAEAVAMLEAFEKSIERQAATLIESKGKEAAIQWAARLLEVVSA